MVVLDLDAAGAMAVAGDDTAMTGACGLNNKMSLAKSHNC